MRPSSARGLGSAAALPLLALVLLSGCAGGPDSFCETAQATLVVDQVTGTDLLVDGRSLVLHAAGSEVFLRTAEGCSRITAADVRAGDRFAHDAKEIAASYPGQAWPETVVVVRP